MTSQTLFAEPGHTGGFRPLSQAGDVDKFETITPWNALPRAVAHALLGPPSMQRLAGQANAGIVGHAEDRLGLGSAG
jgi:hypothetical protein